MDTDGTHWRDFGQNPTDVELSRVVDEFMTSNIYEKVKVVQEIHPKDGQLNVGYKKDLSELTTQSDVESA